MKPRFEFRFGSKDGEPQLTIEKPLMNGRMKELFKKEYRFKFVGG